MSRKNGCLRFLLASALLCGAFASCDGDASAPTERPVATDEQAREVVRSIFAGDYEAVRADFDETMAAELSEGRLAEARRAFEARFGTFESMGVPEILERGDLTVFNIPLEMSKREGEARITYDPDNRIAGLYLLRPGVPVP